MCRGFRRPKRQSKHRRIQPFFDCERVQDRSAAIPSKSQWYENGKLTSNFDNKSRGPTIWVGDKELALRVFNAFKQVEKLCKPEAKKEPFD